MANKTVLIVIVVIAVLVVAAIGGGVFYTVVLPKLTDDDDDDGNKTKNKNNGDDDNLNPVPVILVKDDTMNISANREFNVNEVVWFDGTQSQGNITRFIWDFGDGTTREGPGENYGLVNHTYTERGIFTINLTVVASNNARGKTNVTVTILGEPYTDTVTEVLSSRVGSSNVTSTFPVEDDARNITLEVSATGISQDITAMLIIEVYNPYHELMDNASLSFVISGTHDFYFGPSEIGVTGNYFIEMSCQSGTMRVIIDIYVGY